jgi:hypothetical protein
MTTSLQQKLNVQSLRLTHDDMMKIRWGRLLFVLCPQAEQRPITFTCVTNHTGCLDNRNCGEPIIYLLPEDGVKLGPETTSTQKDEISGHLLG